MIIEAGSSNRSTLNPPDRVKLSAESRSNADAFGARKNVWSRQGSKFKALHDEEGRIVQQRTAKDWLYAHFSSRESGECSSFWLAGETTETARAEFELLATEAGIALGSPVGIPPQRWWLHGLFLDLRATGSKHLRLFSDHGGIIEQLSEASATYCLRLDRRSLEETMMSIVPPEFKRGYRAEIRQWMSVECVSTVEDAARRLGLSLSALKSIMSSRGICRYGDATLSRVLGRIGYRDQPSHDSPLSPPSGTH